MIIGFAPAGGCITPASAIQKIVKPTARLIEITLDPNNKYIATPIKAEIICPPIIFRGCDSGAFHTTNTSTQLPPSDAINHGVPV